MNKNKAPLPSQFQPTTIIIIASMTTPTDANGGMTKYRKGPQMTAK